MTTRDNQIEEPLSDATKKKILDLLDQLATLIPLNPLSDAERAALAKPGDEQLDALSGLFTLAANNPAIFGAVYDAAGAKIDQQLHDAIKLISARLSTLDAGVTGTYMLVRSDLARTGENLYDYAQRYSDRLPPGSDAAIEPARKFYGRRARRRAP
jgi:hypothetical protein